MQLGKLPAQFGINMETVKCRVTVNAALVAGSVVNLDMSIPFKTIGKKDGPLANGTAVKAPGVNIWPAVILAEGSDGSNTVEAYASGIVNALVHMSVPAIAGSPVYLTSSGGHLSDDSTGRFVGLLLEGVEALQGDFDDPTVKVLFFGCDL